MTLLVALRGVDGLALAADSRGTFGDPRGITAQNDAQQKAHILSHRTAVLAAGASEVGALVIEQARAYIQTNGIDGVTPVMEALSAQPLQRLVSHCTAYAGSGVGCYGTSPCPSGNCVHRGRL
jgi:20S proteasome alpha/beta subunit